MVPQLYRWIKNSKVRGRFRRKTLAIFDPHVRAAVQDTGFTSDFEFILNTAFTSGTQIFPKQCPVSYCRTSRSFLPVNCIRLLGYCWQ